MPPEFPHVGLYAIEDEYKFVDPHKWLDFIKTGDSLVFNFYKETSDHFSKLFLTHGKGKEEIFLYNGEGSITLPSSLFYRGRFLLNYQKCFMASVTIDEKNSGKAKGECEIPYTPLKREEFPGAMPPNMKLKYGFCKIDGIFMDEWERFLSANYSLHFPLMEMPGNLSIPQDQKFAGEVFAFIKPATEYYYKVQQKTHQINFANQINSKMAQLKEALDQLNGLSNHLLENLKEWNFTDPLPIFPPVKMVNEPVFPKSVNFHYPLRGQVDAQLDKTVSIFDKALDTWHSTLYLEKRLLKMSI